MEDFHSYIKNHSLQELNMLGLSDASAGFGPRSTHDLRTFKKGNDTYYVKFPAPQSFAELSPELQSIVEHLAYKIYRMFGIKVPVSHLVINQGGNSVGIATVGVNGQPAKDASKLIGHKDLNMGFFVDAFIANWDVVGLLYDNIILADDGSAYRIDPGGALTYRAQGGRKGNHFGEDPGEMQSLKTSPQAGKIFSAMNHQQMLEAAELFERIPWNLIDQTINNTQQEALIKAGQLTDKTLQTRLEAEIVTEFREIHAKLQVRYQKVIEFIRQLKTNNQ